MINEWADHAACAQTDGEAWFPPGPQDSDRMNAAYAISVCQNVCPVRAQCLEKALRLEGGASKYSRYGIWGGMTPRQRAAEAKARALTRKHQAQGVEV